METAYPNPATPDSPENTGAVETPSISLEQLSELAKEVLGTMLPLLSFEVKMNATLESNTVRIRMECDDAGRLIGRRGTTVNEIQFLLNRILQRKHKGIPRVFLDVDGGKEEAAAAAIAGAPEVPNEAAVERVKEVVAKVRRWGEPADTELMSETDRKTVQDFYSRDRELDVVAIQSKDDRNGMQRLRIQIRK
jgi:spoIIIJ-associated protein